MPSRRSGSNNQLVIPQARPALDQMKFEIAQELGIQLPADGYYGYLATRDTGAMGGYIVRRMCQMAEEKLAGQFMGR